MNLVFSKKNIKLIKDPLDDNNPITVQVLGICSALAITVQLKPAVVMAVSVFFVLCVANVLVSLMRTVRATQKFKKLGSALEGGGERGE